MEGERCYAGAVPDQDDCGTVELNAKVEMVQHPGNVLLVFDTSFSMTMDWNGMPRSQQAAPAIVNALTPLQDQLTIGTVFFPRARQRRVACRAGYRAARRPGRRWAAGVRRDTDHVGRSESTSSPGPSSWPRSTRR